MEELYEKRQFIEGAFQEIQFSNDTPTRFDILSLAANVGSKLADSYAKDQFSLTIDSMLEEGDDFWERYLQMGLTIYEEIMREIKIRSWGTTFTEERDRPDRTGENYKLPKIWKWNKTMNVEDSIDQISTDVWLSKRNCLHPGQRTWSYVYE